MENQFEFVVIVSSISALTDFTDQVEILSRFLNRTTAVAPSQPQPTADTPNNPPTTAADSQDPPTTAEDTETTTFFLPDGDSKVEESDYFLLYMPYLKVKKFL